MHSDDARTRAEGIFEVSVRRNSGYALVLVSHCVVPFVFEVKLARDDDVRGEALLARDDDVVICRLTMTDQVPE